MMRLDDLLQQLDDLDGDLNIFVVPPYAAESLAAVGSSAPDAFKLVCDVRSAKAMLASYKSDPIAMSVARFRANAEERDHARAVAWQAVCTFSFEGLEVGFFEPAPPTRDGVYRFMPFMGPGSYQLVEALRRGDRPRCAMPSCSFTVVGIRGGERQTLEIVGFVFNS